MQSVGELGVQRSLYLLAGLAGMHLVQNAQERSQLAFAIQRVHIVVDGNVAHTLAGEVEVRVLAGHDVVTSESGQILRDDAVDLAILNVVDHPLESWTVKVRARPAIVDVFVHHVQTMLLRVLAKHHSLRADAAGFAGQLIITAESHV